MPRPSTQSSTSVRRSQPKGRWDVLNAVATDANTAAVARVIATLVIVGMAGLGLSFGFRHLQRLFFRGNPKFALKSLQIKAGNTVSIESIRQATGLREGANIFSFDLPGIRSTFLRTVPNVRDIRLERHLPGTMLVSVFERVPMARLGRSGGDIVDFDGYLFKVQPAQESLLDTLPVLTGEEWADLKPGQRIGERPRSALTVLDAADAMRLGFRIAAIDTTEPHYLLLQTTDRHEIGLPWKELASRDAITNMLGNASATLLSPWSANCNRFDVVPEADAVKIYARYQ
jgi:hypothetical protein